jgi:hypothetical protein
MSPRPPDGRSARELVAALSASHFNERALALAELVRRGRASTAALVAALPTAGGELRARIAQGLAEIADPSTADAFAAMLDDADEQLRARGAQGLVRISDRRAVDALLQTIDDYPDILREPDTLSTDALTDLGPSVLPRVVPLLKAPGLMTRARAFLVLRRIFPRLDGGGDWQSLWVEFGRYLPAAEQPQRDAAADRWIAWVERQAC